MEQKRLSMLIAVLTFICTTLSAQNLVAKYCMSYSDFAEGRWSDVDSLVGGRAKQVCQLKQEDNQYKVKTGDKEADACLKKEALALQYGNHLYVNCRNLRCKDIPLDVTNYSQAYRYGEDKLLVVAHWISGAAVLAGIAGDAIFFASPFPVAVPAFVASEALWIGIDKMTTFRCYLLDADANAKGKYAVTRLTDEVMEKILADSPELMERYKAVTKKNARQSAANILPVLVEKGLIKGL